MEQRNEMVALNALAKAAELYLASLDELTRPVMTQHLQSAVTVLVNVLNPSVGGESTLNEADVKSDPKAE